MGRGHLLDGDTFALYTADESNLDLFDSSTNALHLTASSATGVVVASLFADAGKARFFDGAYTIDGTIGQSGPMGTWNAMLAGEHTFETWVRLADGDAAERRIFEFGAVGENEADNVFYFAITAARKLTTAWEQGAGANVVYVTTASIPVNPNHVTIHAAYKKRSVGGGNYVIDFFVNGALIETSSSLANYTGGSNGIMHIGGSTGGLLFGRLDDLRFSRIARLDADILESYKRGTIEPLLLIEE